MKATTTPADLTSLNIILEMASYPGKYFVKYNGPVPQYTSDPAEARKFKSRAAAEKWMKDRNWLRSWVNFISL